MGLYVDAPNGVTFCSFSVSLDTFIQVLPVCKRNQVMLLLDHFLVVFDWKLFKHALIHRIVLIPAVSGTVIWTGSHLKDVKKSSFSSTQIQRAHSFKSEFYVNSDEKSSLKATSQVYKLSLLLWSPLHLLQIAHSMIWWIKKCFQLGSVIQTPTL